MNNSGYLLQKFNFLKYRDNKFFEMIFKIFFFFEYS